MTTLPHHNPTAGALHPTVPPPDADEAPALQDRLAAALAVLGIVGAWVWLAAFVASH